MTDQAEDNTRANGGNDPQTEKSAAKLDESYEQCEKERAEYLAGWQRARADLANFKREEDARIREIVKFSQEMLLRELTAVLQSFQLGMSSWREESSERTGMRMIQNQLLELVRRYGLEEIRVEIGKQFDPKTQETIETIEHPDKESGTVVEELEKGYILRGKAIKPAKVRVVK